MEIRHMEPNDDRYAIGRIYEESWKYAYRDIIPKSYLDNIHADRWVYNLDQGGRNTLLLIENDTFIGTSSYCKSRYQDFNSYGEIV